MKPVVGLVLAALMAAPMAATAAEDPPSRDLCLRVEPVDAGRKGEATRALWLDTPQKVAKSIRQGQLEVTGPGKRCDDEWEPIVAIPRDDLVNVSETRWSKLEFHNGGRMVDVYFGLGVPECGGLSHVEVTTSDAGLDVRVFVGDLPFDERARACPQPLLSWVTTVDLEERLAFGSRGEDREAEIVWQQEVQALKMEAIHELAERLPGYIRFVPHESDYYEEDFRFTAEGRQYALQFFKNPETTKDDLVNLLLKQEGLKPTYPPYPGQEGPSPAD